MKKKVAVLSVLGIIFMVAAFVATPFLGMMYNPAPYDAMTIFKGIGTLFTGAFTPVAWTSFIGAGVAALFVILMIIQVIMAAKKKHGPATGVSIVAVLAAVASYLFLNLTVVTPGGAIAALFAVHPAGVIEGPIGIGISLIASGNWAGLVLFAPALVYLIGFILVLIAIISDMKLLSDLPDPVLDPAAQDSVVVIPDEDAETEVDPNQGLIANPSVLPANTNPTLAPGPNPCGGVPGVQGPFIIQYINTYAPPAAEQPAAEPVKKNAVPVSEIQGAITGEKPLTAEDIRKIVREEMGEKKDQPVIVNVPATPKEEAPAPALTAEDVRQIFSEELGRYLSSEDVEDEYPEESEIFVEEEPAPALTAEDVRSIIAAELARSKPETAAQSVEKPEEPVDVRAVIRDELEAHRREMDEEARRKAQEEAERKAREEELAKARAEAAEEARRQAEEEAAAREAATPALTADDIRAIIASELARKEPAPEPEKKPEMTLDLIREVIRSELRDVAPVREEKVPPVTVVVKESDIVRPTPAPEPKPVEEPKPEPVMPVVNIIVKSPEPEPEPVVEHDAVEEPVEEAPATAQDSVTVEEKPAADKIIRIPFPVRMMDAEPDLVKNYNEIKSEIMSYGVKSRVSNSGDTFRLHKVTFVKITIAGKGLKLYFALNPEDYASSTLPVQNAGHKGTYRDIPLVFKVKSDLSVRRAKQLIADVMEKNGLEQGKIEYRDWAADLKDYKPAGAPEDDDED